MKYYCRVGGRVDLQVKTCIITHLLGCGGREIMPKRVEELTALVVARIKVDGLHSVGGVPGLYLQIINSFRTWILKATIGTRKNEKGQTVPRRREIGLGRYPDVSLAEARDQARELHKQIRNGIDPVEERRIVKAQAKLAMKKTKTFRECAEAFIETNRAGWRNEKHVQQWTNTLAMYAYPVIGGLSIADIDAGLVLSVLQQPVDTADGQEPFWNAKTETASRLRGRIESVLQWAKVRGLRTGENPAEWKTLKFTLPAKRKVAKEENHPALPYTEICAFMAELRLRCGVAASALEFAILTAARSGEVRRATWDEIDLTAQVWTIPALHMKREREHYVPLSDTAVKLLESLPRHEGHNHIFPTEQAAMLSDMALLMVIRRMHRTKFSIDGKGWIDPKQDNRIATVHGFRSAFRDWAGETTSHPREVVEHALAHGLPDKTEAAYQRGTLFDKRKALMTDWERYCNTIPTAKGIYSKTPRD